MKTSFNQLLQGNKPLIGTLLSTSVTEIAEIVANAGFDWVFIDMEHGCIEPSHVQKLLQTLKAGSLALVRIPENNATWFKKVLDTGADGVIVPLINTPEEARLAVAYSKYPPVGTRSVGIGRAQGYGTNFASYVKTANDMVSLILQIEHIQAVENIEKILSMTGIDGVLIGPYDLSGSMGLLGDVQNTKVQQTIKQVQESCLKRRIPVGI